MTEGRGPLADLDGGSNDVDGGERGAAMVALGKRGRESAAAKRRRGGKMKGFNPKLS